MLFIQAVFARELLAQSVEPQHCDEAGGGRLHGAGRCVSHRGAAVSHLATPARPLERALFGLFAAGRSLLSVQLSESCSSQGVQQGETTSCRTQTIPDAHVDGKQHQEGLRYLLRPFLKIRIVADAWENMIGIVDNKDPHQFRFWNQTSPSNKPTNDRADQTTRQYKEGR